MSKFLGGVEHYLCVLSPNSQRQYRSIVKEWVNFCGSDEAAFVSNQGNIWAYIAELKKRKGQTSRLDGDDSLSWGTIQRKLIILKALYDHLMKIGLVLVNPFDDPQFIKKRVVRPKRPTEAVNFEEVRHLIEMPDQNTKAGVRDSCILCMLFAGGFRRSEVPSIKIADVFISEKGNCSIKLSRQKNGCVTNQMMPDWAVPYIEKYLKIRLLEAKKHDPFITHYLGDREIAENIEVGDQSLYHWFKKYCRRAHLPETLSPHSCRATSITKLLKDGLSYREVQEFSRHSSVHMVEVYDKRSFDDENSPSKKLAFD